MANISTLLKNIKEAVFGKDVRNSIHDAIKQCYDDAIANGHTDMEIANARGKYANLESRLDADNEDVNEKIKFEKEERIKADNNLQSQINSLASGSPKGTYATTAALKTANPDTGVYIVTANGHIYSWTKDSTGDPVDLGVYQATSIPNGSIAPRKTTFIKEYNIIDKSLIVNNKRPSTAQEATINTIIDDSNISYTDQIWKVEEGDIIRFNYQYVCCVFYNSNGVLVSAPVGAFKQATVPSGATQMRIWTNTPKYSDLMVSINTELPDEYYEYGEYDCNIRPKKEIEINKLWGKSVYFDGDSVCAGYGNNNVSYADMISSNNNMTKTKTAVSGTTISKKENQSNSILERVLANSANTYDYVIIEGGLNDMFQSIALGEISDGFMGTFNDYTFTGALEHLCRALVMNCASAKKGFILTNRKVNDYMDSQKIYWDRAKEVLEKWSIPYIDLSTTSGCLPLNDTLLNRYFFIPSGATVGDGTHPNELGYKTFFVDQITAWMKTL